MKKINTIIFSYNRAAQLDFLLQSIIRFDEYERLSVVVQYLTTNKKYEDGYEILIKKYPGITFTKEFIYANKKLANPLKGFIIFNSFFWLYNKRYRYYNSNYRSLLISNLKESNSQYVMFLTDDSCFYSKIRIEETVLAESVRSKGDSFSLVLGLNIKRFKPYPSNDYFKWQIDKKYPDKIWNYPFSVDGRIYNRDYILKYINKLSFTNPNTFESLMVISNRVTSAFKMISLNHAGCLIGFELNRVQNTFNNNNLNIDTNLINDYFLNGYELVIDFEEKGIHEFRPKVRCVYMKRGNENKIIYS
jgi:hypothetical protein